VTVLLNVIVRAPVLAPFIYRTAITLAVDASAVRGLRRVGGKPPLSRKSVVSTTYSNVELATERKPAALRRVLPAV
jgi:hypothetical protein